MLLVWWSSCKPFIYEARDVLHQTVFYKELCLWLSLPHERKEREMKYIIGYCFLSFCGRPWGLTKDQTDHNFFICLNEQGKTFVCSNLSSIACYQYWYDGLRANRLFTKLETFCIRPCFYTELCFWLIWPHERKEIYMKHIIFFVTWKTI